ncbi:MAG TPA: ribosomal-processing cysteine protease Prp [Spirochaetota bacterium]|nr:ribosomal-processing cysteine protease Prp [Spirochaetota bacterium]
MVRVILDSRGAVSWHDAAGIDELGIRIEGHAGLGSKGTDVVCAGISAIVQAAVVGITKVAGIQQDVVQDEGLLETRIALVGVPESRKKALVIIVETMFAGLREIEREYPGSLEISIR